MYTVDVYQDYGMDSEALAMTRDFNSLSQAKDWLDIARYTVHETDDNGNVYYSNHYSSNWAILSFEA